MNDKALWSNERPFPPVYANPEQCVIVNDGHEWEYKIGDDSYGDWIVRRCTRCFHIEHGVIQFKKCLDCDSERLSQAEYDILDGFRVLLMRNKTDWSQRQTLLIKAYELVQTDGSYSQIDYADAVSLLYEKVQSGKECNA